MKKLVMAMGLMTPLSFTYAAGLDIRVGEDSIGFILGASDTNTESAAEAALFYNEDRDFTVLNAGLFVTGSKGKLAGRVGAKAFAADLDSIDGYGVALGADVTYPLSFNISVETGLYFAPGALTFGDFDRYRQWYVSASYSMFDNAKLAIGIGSLEIDDEFDNSIEVDDGAFFEMKLRF